MGNLVKVNHVDAWVTTTMEYDLLGNKTKLADMDLGIWRYAYDRKGNLVRQVDALGKVICLYYDRFDRVTYKVFFVSAQGCPAE